MILNYLTNMGTREINLNYEFKPNDLDLSSKKGDTIPLKKSFYKNNKDLEDLIDMVAFDAAGEMDWAQPDYDNIEMELYITWEAELFLHITARPPRYTEQERKEMLAKARQEDEQQKMLHGDDWDEWEDGMEWVYKSIIDCADSHHMSHDNETDYRYGCDVGEEVISIKLTSDERSTFKKIFRRSFH